MDCLRLLAFLRGVSVTGLKVWRTTHLATKPRWPAWCFKLPSEPCWSETATSTRMSWQTCLTLCPLG